MSEAGHAQVVDGWLERSARDLPQEQLVDLFEATLRTLLHCTETTLGDVTLSAIIDRVLYNAVEAFPAFASLRFESGEGVQCAGLRTHLGTMRDGELREGVRFVIVELLTVLGNLTAEILTPELHAELSKVVVAAPRKSTSQGDKRP